ncbi:MAG: hypothetical protein KatS3mg102_1012 [Planctomycetota bacterium]|nr:MAG: hypothetical protein KatS3mg102_1012 [Planctomycetota bacterium]
MAREPLEGIEAYEEKGPLSRARLWERMREEIERREQEEAARQGQVLAPGQAAAEPGQQPEAGTAEQAAAGAAGLGAVLRQSPEERRLEIMAAMQADALARLEIPEHADQLVAQVRAGEQLDLDARLARLEEGLARRQEREATEREMQKRPETIGKADDYVERIAAPEHRTAQERLEDARDRRQRRLDR